MSDGAERATASAPLRHRWIWRTLLGLVIVAIVLVLGFTVFVQWAQPGDPSEFYDPPSALPAGPPGTIIRDEDVEDPGAGMVATKVLYTSTDPAGTAIAVSGVVIAPSGA